MGETDCATHAPAPQWQPIETAPKGWLHAGRGSAFSLRPPINALQLLRSCFSWRAKND